VLMVAQETETPFSTHEIRTLKGHQRQVCIAPITPPLLWAVNLAGCEAAEGVAAGAKRCVVP